MTWKGIAFPFTIEDCGVACSEDLENIRQSIFLILATRKGERPFRPDFGSNLFDLVDAPLNAKTKALIVYECVSAIQEYEPRVQLRRIMVIGEKPSEVSIVAEYDVPALKVSDTLKLFWDRVNRKWQR